MTEVSPSNYWIASNALYITLNANGAPNYIQGNTASGAHILCYVKGVDGLEYDAAHNYRRWPLSLTPTKFNTNTEKYVYVAIPRPNTPDNTAVVVFPSEKLDLYGKNEADQQIGSDLYYYVWLQGIITATNAGETLDREWQQRVDTGILSSDEAIDAGDNQTWWHYSSVDDAVTFLKEIWLDSQSFFHNLKAKILILAGHELNGVATADTGDEYVDSETLVVTPSYLKSKTEDKFLRKDQDDATPYSLGVGGDLNVGGIFRAITGYITSLFTDLVQSSNYTGDGIGDTGFRLTADDGSGSSSMVVDNLHVRKKATFEEVEVKKETAVAGNEVRSAAANIINRTDYIDAQGEVIGYSVVHVPWVIRKMPLLLQNMFYARMRRLRIVIDSEDVQYIAKVRCYFLAKDGDRDVQNLWQAHDLARCQTFNLTQSKRLTYISSDTQTKLGNIYWWRKVVGVSTQTENIDGKDYHYFDVSMTDCDANSDIPAAGDHVVQFGNDSDEQRMNLIVQEVNGTDAPSVKAYMGIYTYNLNKCWWGGSPRKMMLSPRSGYEFYGPSFKFIQEYGKAPASIDRGVWTEITTERDDYAPHNQVRKLYYYDKVSHNGCYWLCVMTNNVGAHWVADIAFTETVGGTTYTFSAGDYIPDDVYNVLVTNKTNCSRKENYITDTPSEGSTNWKKLVDSGDNMIHLDIDNEMDAVQTDSTGKVTAQHTITTTVRLYDGATEVAINNPTVSGISYTDAQGQQQTLNPTITASGNGKQLSWTFLVGWTLQARYQVNISYTYLDVPYNAVFTITASQGMAIFQLKPSLSAIAFQRDGNNQLTPASKTLGLNIVKIDGGSTADITPATYGVAKIRYSLTEMPALVSSGTAWPSVGDVTVPNTAENVYIALFNAYDILIDRETVPVIKDGEKGANGQDAWVFDLDNEMDSVSCDDTGVVVGSDQTINTTGRLFKGTTRKAFYLYGGITRNGVAFTYDSENDKFVYGNEIELWRDATDANIFHIKYKVGAVISGKDDIAIGIQAQDDASVIYTGHIIVNGVVGDVYNLLPAQNELHGWKSQDGHYYIGNLNNFQFLTCGYKKKVNGVVTEYNNVTGQIDGKYNIYFRLHQRANNIWDPTYYLYTARSTVSQFYLDDYDGIEYILCTNTSYDTTTPTNVIDREEVWILSDGSAGKDAAEVRPNLLKQTQFINGQMNQWYLNEGEIIVNGFDGHNTIHLNLNNTIGQYVQGTGHEVLEPATVYTISFWSKGVIFIDINPGDTGEAYAVFDRAFGRWIDGVKESDYVNDFGYIWEDSDWTYHTYTFKTAASFDGSLANLYWHSPNWYTGSTGCYLCMPKLERGDTATAYLANEWDTRGIVSANIYYTAAASAPQTPSGAPIPSGWADNGNNLITSGNAALHLYESTCTTYSDGTYSWTTPLDDGLISDMAATSEEFGLSDFNNTPPSSWSSSQRPTAGKWIWSRTVLTYVGGGTTYIPNANGQCIGYCGTTPQKGVDYFDGDDSVNVMLSPEEVLVTQATTSPYGIDLSNAFTIVSLNKGGSPDSNFTISNVSGHNCQASIDANNNKKVNITDIDTYTPQGESTSVFYDNGYVTFDVSYGGNTFPKRFNFYANLLGTWKADVEGGVSTVVARVVDYNFIDGKLVSQTNRSYQQTASAAQEFNQWASAYQSASGESVDNLNTRISTAEGNTNTVTKKVNNGKNLLTLTSGWEGYQGAAVSYDEKNFGVRNANGNLYSPVYYGVEGETYCFSVYIASGYHFSGNPGYCYSSTQPTHASDIDDNGVYQSASFIEVTGDTITIGSTTYQRYYFLIPGSIVKERYFTIYNDGNYWFYCPQLEVGNTPSAFAAGSIETTSQIKQTANEIDASVRDDLGETGINIKGNNKTITLKGEHVVFQNSAGNLITPKISIDPNTGVLHAVDGDFSGSVSVGNGGLTCSINNGNQTIVFEENTDQNNKIWYGFAATSKVNGIPGDILSLGGRIDTTTGAGLGRLVLTEVTTGNPTPIVLFETVLQPGCCTFNKDAVNKYFNFGFFDDTGDELWIQAPLDQWRKYNASLRRDGYVYVDTAYGILRVKGYNDSSLPWGSGGGGTVTSITAGTGLSGGTITGSGTISISSTYQTYISNGNTAYGWGDHRQAGYLTSVAFSNLTSHPTSIAGYGITDAYISGGTIHLGSNSITPLSNDMGENYLYFTNGAYLKYTSNDRDSVLDIACQDNIHIDSGANVTIEADSNINIESGYQVNITGDDAVNIISNTDGIYLNAPLGVDVTGNLSATGFAEIDSYISTGGNVLRKGLGTFYVGWNDNGSINNGRPHIQIGDNWIFVKNQNPSNNSTPRNYFGLDSDGWFVCKFYDSFHFQDTNNNKTILEYDINDDDFLHCNTDFEVNGDVTADSFNQGSDINRKNVICALDLNIYNIANADLFRYTWKDGKDTQTVHVGTSAQYWQTVLPETVIQRTDGTLAMQYDVVALAAAITTAKTVATHEDRITILERENDALKNRIKKLENTIFIN